MMLGHEKQIRSEIVAFLDEVASTRYHLKKEGNASILLALGPIIVYREEGDLRWSTIRRRFWLNTPRDRKTSGRVAHR